jgi:phosphatidylserine/phosphatidylglycerophosphate/cardiolipin synthase-like enzyme
VTPQRVRAYESVFRAKIAEGIKIRCVARPPHDNGSIPYGDGRAALDALEAMGCIVDTRKDTHEKLVIVDGETLWFGSLNPLSHSSQTGEVMARINGGVDRLMWPFRPVAQLIAIDVVQFGALHKL